MSNDRLQHLLDLARRGRPIPPLEELPPALATRVAARWVGSSRQANAGEIWERLCWWGMGAAAVICIVTVSLHPHPPEPTAFEILLSIPSTTAFPF